MIIRIGDIHVFGIEEQPVRRAEIRAGCRPIVTQGTSRTTDQPRNRRNGSIHDADHFDVVVLGVDDVHVTG